MVSGLQKIKPDSRDFHFLKTYGSITPDPQGLPVNFSIYDGRTIPDQNEQDYRFANPLPPLPYGCTGETGAFESGIQDGTLYNPQDLYLNTPPGDSGGRDIRAMLQTLIDRGVEAADGSMSPKRLAYFNVYGSGKIDDFDAARIAIWVNQYEKRGVYVGTYWYWGEASEAYLSIPSYRTLDGTLHCYLVTGWNGDYLQVIPWLGQNAGNAGVFYVSREIYNNLMRQPFTGAFSITKVSSMKPVPIGAQAWIDHLTYFIRQLFGL